MLRVTPYAGVWIEIGIRQYVKMTVDVTPYAGVWIEIISRKSRQRYLKVTPYAGVWIEIRNIYVIIVTY